MEYKQQTLPGMSTFRNRTVDPPEKKRIVAPVESRYIPKPDNIDINTNEVIISESPAKLSINRNNFKNKKRSVIRNPEVLQLNYQAAALKEIQQSIAQPVSTFSEPTSSLRIKRNPRSINRINIQAPSNSAIPTPLEIPYEQYEQMELNFGNGTQDLGSNSGEGQISISNRKNNPINRRKILAPTDTPVSEVINKNIETLSSKPVANFSQNRKSIKTVNRSASGQRRITQIPETIFPTIESENFVEDINSLENNTVIESEKPSSFATKNNYRVARTEPKRKIINTPLETPSNIVDTTIENIVPEEISNPEVKKYADLVSEGTKRNQQRIIRETLASKDGISKLNKIALDAKTGSELLSYPTITNVAQAVKLQDIGNIPNVGPSFYNTNAIDNIQKINRSAQIGKKLEEDFINPKSSSLKKYGKYTLGALAGTALINALFFGDKKGEQTNAQLYGQQPLY